MKIILVLVLLLAGCGSKAREVRIDPNFFKSLQQTQEVNSPKIIDSETNKESQYIIQKEPNILYTTKISSVE